MAANVAGVDAYTLNVLTLSYLATRVVYNYIYVFAQDNRNIAPARSLVWMTGVGLAITLYIKAAAKMY